MTPHVRKILYKFAGGCNDWKTGKLIGNCLVNLYGRTFTLGLRAFVAKKLTTKTPRHHGAKENITSKKKRTMEKNKIIRRLPKFILSLSFALFVQAAFPQPGLLSIDPPFQAFPYPNYHV
jgi:hypothetical protein